MGLKLSDEQYEEIWQAVARIGLPRTSAECGRAVVDAVFAEVLPVVLAEPSDEDAKEIANEVWAPQHLVVKSIIELWHRKLLARFTAPKKDEKPVSDLLWKSNPFPNTGAEHRHDAAVWEAYERGLRAADREAGR